MLRITSSPLNRYSSVNALRLSPWSSLSGTSLPQQWTLGRCLVWRHFFFFLNRGIRHPPKLFLFPLFILPLELLSGEALFSLFDLYVKKAFLFFFLYLMNMYYIQLNYCCCLFLSIYCNLSKSAFCKSVFKHFLPNQQLTRLFRLFESSFEVFKKNTYELLLQKVILIVLNSGRHFTIWMRN